MQAIQTKYNGVLYRSRTEARWAAFFDAAGIRAQYETEGYWLSSGLMYLPDFYLPELNVYAEVKGAEPTELEHEKANRLQSESRKQVWFLIGPPSESDNPVLIDGRRGNFHECRRCSGLVMADCVRGYWAHGLSASDCDYCAEKFSLMLKPIRYALTQRFGVHEAGQ